MNRQFNTIQKCLTRKKDCLFVPIDKDDSCVMYRMGCGLLAAGLTDADFSYNIPDDCARINSIEIMYLTPADEAVSRAVCLGVYVRSGNFNTTQHWSNRNVNENKTVTIPPMTGYCYKTVKLNNELISNMYAGDGVIFSVQRNGDAAEDTATVNFIVRGMIINYSSTLD